MTKKIRIIEVPASSIAPEEIRKQWMGIEIPLASSSGDQENPGWSGRDNLGGYIVNTDDAITALRDAGRDSAADFWSKVKSMTGHQLRFISACCEIV